MNKIKVLFYLERWSSGGIEAIITGILSEGSITERVTAHIAANIIEDSIFTERLKGRGIVFHELSGKLRSSRNARSFRRLLCEGGYDAVHFNIFHGLSLRLIKIAKSEGVKVRIAHSHGSGLRKSPLRPLKLMLSRLGRIFYGSYATERIAPSREAARFLFGSREFKIIENGIDSERFRFSEEKRRNTRHALGVEKSTVIGHIGRFSEEKNHAFILEILKEILNTGRDARLLLAGDGPLLGETKRRAEALGISDRIVFLGTVKNAEDYLSAMDLFILPSTSEGFGIAAVEAQASGLVTLISDRVPKELLILDTSLSLPLDSARVWADACIEKAGTKLDRCTGVEAVKKSGYDISRLTAQILSLYERGVE